ncbi:MAG: sugar ABC transporter permease [Lachnospiraceae bacterium]|nr:sugar ABC transporter permease [Lachnospiraceae bacterium]
MKEKKSNFVLQPIKEAWANGDTFTKLSFFIMGLSNILRKQIVKGLLFLGSELGFLIFMLSAGFAYLSEMFQKTLGNPPTKGFSESGIPITIAGDNSMIILLRAVAILFLVGLFCIVWRTNVKSAYKVQELQEMGKRIPTVFDDIKDLFDSQLHKTLLMLPIFGIIIFNLIPIVFMIFIAFTNYDAAHQPPSKVFSWVGLSNFIALLNPSGKFGSTFLNILLWTFIWAIFATFLNYIFGMILAILINRKGTKYKKFWRTMFVISIAVPQFVSLLLIRIMLSEYGPVNSMLNDIFGVTAPFWTNATWARVTIIIVNLWVGMPYTMLVTTGILQNIPSDLYESAKVDGANAATIFWKITLPYMLFVTTPKLITDFVGNLNNFNVIYFLTAGEPLSSDYFQAAGKTDLLVTWLYKLTVDKADYCYAAVIGIAVFVISATLSLIVYRNTGSYKNEEGFQ